MSCKVFRQINTFKVSLDPVMYKGRVGGIKSFFGFFLGLTLLFSMGGEGIEVEVWSVEYRSCEVVKSRPVWNFF